MKANELMIGDWVRCTDPKPFQLKIIDEIDHVACGEDCFMVDIADLQPIPLTAEILEKNYEEVCRSKDGTSYEWSWRVETGYVEISKSEDAYGVNRYWLTANDGECRVMLIRYLHELQHALRLCGVDKEIEL